MDKSADSLHRAAVLKEKNRAFLAYKESAKLLENSRAKAVEKNISKLLSFFNATIKDWYNWHWQMKNRITNTKTLQKLLNLSKHIMNDIDKVAESYRFAIAPYYLAQIINTEHDPLFMLAIPTIKELINIGEIDPMNERNTNPAGSITRRYPDRLIINVSNVCAMYCRHCQRRRLINTSDHHTPIELIDESIQYIRDNMEIRDVLLTGGDALLLSNRALEDIIKRLRDIPHVEIIRIGTRTPVTMPMRITSDLVNMLKKYHPIYLNTHFNHYYEITEDSKKACEKLANAGVYLGNQAVLLKGINDNPFTMTYLNQKLLSIRVRPYYIFHAKNVIGTTHFIPKLSDGLKIMEFMRGNTSGLAIPTYIMNAPGGLGKVPLLPEYIIKKDSDTYTIRTWENIVFEYKEK